MPRGGKRPGAGRPRKSRRRLNLNTKELLISYSNSTPTEGVTRVFVPDSRHWHFDPIWHKDCLACNPEHVVRRKLSWGDVEKHADLKSGVVHMLLKLQEGRCAICGEPDGLRGRLVLDHDHETGKLRGLLCDRCNRALGMLRDSTYVLAQAINYLKEPPAQRLK